MVTFSKEGETSNLDEDEMENLKEDLEKTLGREVVQRTLSRCTFYEDL